MQIDQILSKFKKTIPDNLPGFDAQLKMSPPFRGKYTIDSIQKFNPKPSAVLILLYPKEESTHLVFIERVADGKPHSGQIAFPGGRKEESDADFTQTAVREAKEEVGVDEKKIVVAGNLTSLYVPASNYIIQPVLAFSDHTLDFTPQQSEVKKIIEVPLEDFMKPETTIQMKIEDRVRNFEMVVPAFYVQNQKIWGATAMIMSEFLEILKKQ